MRNMTRAMGLMVLLLMPLLPACSYIFSAQQSMPVRHPEEVSDRNVDCTECHEDAQGGPVKRYESFRHSITFFKNHGYLARQESRTCTLCHAESFCVDCHGTKPADTPNLTHGDNPELEFDHRGDYIIRHRIDGRADPTGCYKCHGRSNNQFCRNCHRTGGDR